MYSIKNAYPLTQHTLCCYVAYLGKQGLTPATIKVYLSALRRHQISSDMPAPGHTAMPKLQAVQLGVAKAHVTGSDPGPHPQKRLPITPPILRAVKEVWKASTTDHDTIMLWAICSLAFFGFFRLGEIILGSARFDPAQHLAVGDIEVDNREYPSLLKVHLKTSKTDQLRRGADPGPLFICRDGRTCTKDWFIPKLRTALHAVGLVSTQFAGHSFRIGAASTAAERGVEDSTIKALGRWNSAAYLTYVRLQKEHLASISRTLSTASPQ